MSVHTGVSPIGVKKITVPWVRAQKGNDKISMLTAYDFPTARLVDQAGIEIILVGDSLGPVIYGQENTLSVTLEEMLRHTLAVSQGTTRSLVIGDMPFMSYQVSVEKAVENAGRFLKEAKAHAVKLEGGLEMADTIRAMTRAGIPVMAHIGLTPQSINALGSYRMHGKTEAERDYLITSSQEIEKAGAFAVVLECVEIETANKITKSLSIPTIGIGSGPGCDGQVLVFHDLVGLTLGHVPKFVEATANLKDVVLTAVKTYIERVKKGN